MSDTEPKEQGESSYLDAWFIIPKAAVGTSLSVKGEFVNGEIITPNAVKVFEFDGKTVFHGRFSVEQKEKVSAYKYYVADSYKGLLAAEPGLATAVEDPETGEWEPMPDHKWG